MTSIVYLKFLIGVFEQTLSIYACFQLQKHPKSWSKIYNTCLFIFFNMTWTWGHLYVLQNVLSGRRRKISSYANIFPDVLHTKKIKFYVTDHLLALPKTSLYVSARITLFLFIIYSNLKRSMLGNGS